MYNARVYSIMIVSPSDVSQEREIVKQTIYEWNSIHSDKTNIVLQPIGWDINSFPQMGKHPQEAINQQVLEKADILVALFWTKIGTKTKEYESGSVEEITKHVDLGKDALLYFNTLPVLAKSIDEEQYDSLIEYKKSIQDKAYYFEYDSLTSFSRIFFRHLSLLINDKYLDVNQKIPDFDSYFSKVSISEKAVEILKELIKDTRGVLSKNQYLSGYSVETNGHEFGTDKYDPRIIASLEEAIQQLEEYELIISTNNKRDLFRITAKGYKYFNE